MKKSIIIVYPFYQAGGFEKWAASVASSLHKNYSIQAVLMGNDEVDYGFYDETIMSVRINNIFGVLFYIFKNRPHMVISGFSKWNAILAVFCQLTRLKFVASVHLTLFSRDDMVYSLYQYFCAILYTRLSACVICVSKGIKDELLNMKMVSSQSCKVLYNPCISSDDICSTPSRKINFNPQSRKKIKIIAVGRLHVQKGFDLLLEGLSTSKYKDSIELNIYGDGPELPALIFLREQLGLQCVNFMGVSREIAREYRQHDIFILSSRYEGFGNVLAEALASGLICVAFDIKHGPSEILLDGKYGHLLANLDPLHLFRMVDEVIEGKMLLESDDFQNHCEQFSHASFEAKLQSIIDRILLK